MDGCILPPQQTLLSFLNCLCKWLLRICKYLFVGFNAPSLNMQMIDRIHSLAEGWLCWLFHSLSDSFSLNFFFFLNASNAQNQHCGVWDWMLVPPSSVDPCLSLVILASLGLWMKISFSSFSLSRPYLCFCKGVGSNRVHGWSGKDLEGRYLGWHDRSGTGHSQMKWWNEGCEIDLTIPEASFKIKSGIVVKTPVLLFIVCMATVSITPAGQSYCCSSRFTQFRKMTRLKVQYKSIGHLSNSHSNKTGNSISPE